MENRITLLSTFATDRLVDPSNNLISEQKGGPALFISQAFKDQDLAFDIPYRQDMEVEIMMTKDGEKGKINKKPEVIAVDYANLKSSALVLSTILDEFSLDGINNYPGKVFADVQGYVRDGENFGQKKMWTLPPDSLTDAFDCLKVADYEIDFMPQTLVERQKQKLLLLTQGKKGVTLFAFGETFTMPTTQVAQVENTLGAGDTFLANFVAEYMRNNDPKISTQFAMDQTYQFLIGKSSHPNQSS